MNQGPVNLPHGASSVLNPAIKKDKSLLKKIFCKPKLCGLTFDQINYVIIISISSGFLWKHPAARLTDYCQNIS